MEGWEERRSPDEAGSAEQRLDLHLGGVARVLGQAGERRLERKDAGLLAWLALTGPAPRNRVAGLLWPGGDDRLARSNLRQRLSRLRRSHPALVVDQAQLLRLGEAVHIHPPGVGEAALLAAFDYDDCPEFDTWLQAQRQRARQTLGTAARERAVAAMEAGDLDSALDAAGALVAADADSEEALRLLMEVYYLRGDTGLALEAFDRCREMLRRSFGVAPSALTLALGQRIQEASHRPGAPAPGPGPLPTQQRLPPTLMRPPRLVGRDAALARVQQVLAQGQCLWVAGASGLGKTRLLAEACTALNVTPLPTRADDRTLPFAAARRWLQARWAGRWQAMDEEPRLHCMRLAEPGSDQQPGLAAGPELQRFLALVAAGLRSGPSPRAALVIDDLQFADDDSLALVAALLDQHTAAASTEEPPAALVLAAREEDHAPWLQPLRERFETLSLPPLDTPTLAQLVVSLGLPPLAEAAQAGLIAHSQGRPAALLELLKAAWRRDARSLDDGITALLRQSLAQHLQDRIATLSPPARELLRRMAVAGDAAPATLLDGAAALLDEARAAGIVHEQAFAHDQLRETLLASLAPAEQAQLSLAVANCLVQAGSGPALRVARLLQAGGDAQGAVPHLVQAARESPLAAQSSALWAEAAAQWADQAAPARAFACWFECWRQQEQTRHADPETTVAALQGLRAHACSDGERLLLAACTAVERLGRREFDQACAEIEAAPWPTGAALAATDRALLARALPLIASAYHRAGRSAELLPQLQAMAALVGGEDAEAASQAEAALGSTWLGAGQPARSAQHYERAVALSRRCGDVALEYRHRCTMTAAYLRCGRFDDALGNAMAIAGLAVRTGLEEGRHAESERAALTLYLGRFGESLQLHAAMKRYLQRRGEASGAEVELSLSGVYLHLGRPDLALQALQAISENELMPILRLAWHLQQAVTRELLGLDAEPCWQACERHRERSLHVERLRHQLWRARALAPAAAAREAQAVAQAAEAVHHWHLVRSALTAQAEALLLAGRPRRAAAVADAALASAPHTDLWTGWPVETAWVAYRARLAAGREAAALESLRRGWQWLQDRLAADVPAEFQASFIAGVPLNRALADAARQAGLA